MTPQERVAARAAHTRLLGAALEEPCDVLILDEACAACQLAMGIDWMFRAIIYIIRFKRGTWKNFQVI